MAAALLLIFAPPVLLVAWLTDNHELVYPWALFGARNWLRLSGMKVQCQRAGAHLIRIKPTSSSQITDRIWILPRFLFIPGQRLGLLAKKELLKVPILGYGMGFVNVMAIDRSNRERALTNCRSRYRAHSLWQIVWRVCGRNTRCKPGEFLPFKKGAFYMAAQAGVPIVPIAIKNTDYLMGKGTGEARSGTIEMVMLPPVSTAGVSSDEDVKKLLHHVHNMIGDELVNNSAPAASLGFARRWWRRRYGFVSFFGASGFSISMILTLARAFTKSE